MRWPVVRTIWFREVRDQLRDRRTIFMLLLLPLILYPLLGMSANYVISPFIEKPVTIGVAGIELLEADVQTSPASRHRLKRLPPLVDGDQFAEALFTKDSIRKLLKVKTGTEPELAAELQRGTIDAFLVLDRNAVTRLRDGQAMALDLRLKGEDAAQPRTPDIDAPPELITTDDSGRKAYERLRPVLQAWRQEIVRARMRQLEAPSAHYAEPFKIPLLGFSPFEFARIFPFLIVMMSLTGALYPAIDVCAGEKERGTMETLLISPASRSEIVAGKFLTVWLFSTVSAVLNLGSLGFTVWQFGSALARPGGDFAIPTPSAAALAWGFILLLPLAAFFSAVCVALAVYARSTKEGQYFLMPLTIITLLLTVVSLMPGTELSPFYSLVPVTGASLLLQELMSARTSAEIPWLYLGPVLLPLAVYCYLALQWAIHQFNSEDVLFREAERLDLGLWFKRLLREKEPLPTAGEAAACFVMILALHWYLSLYITGAGLPLLQAAGIVQVAGIAAPPVLMAVLLTSRPLLTLRLQLPRWPVAWNGTRGGSLAALGFWCAIALALGVAVHGPMITLLEWIIDQYPAMKDHLEELTKQLKFDDALWLQLVLLALVPPICEELAFRGFILNGLSTRLSNGNAILISSLLFAFAHGDPFRLVPTFALGVVLALIATRSGSLYPGIVFHAAHNGLAVLSGWLRKAADQEGTEPLWFFTNHGLYGWPAVIASSGLVLLFVVFLIRWRPQPRSST